MYLRQGRWRDRQIIPSKWVRESTANHSRRGWDGGYGYMWWTGDGSNLMANVNVQGHSYFASGWGGHKLIILPYRNLVVVHRVDTDAVGPRPMTHQIGRLLWQILSAAGERDIGRDPSIAAAQGTRLDHADLTRLFTDHRRWVAPNTGIFPDGGRWLTITCDVGGQLFFSVSEQTTFRGKWRVAGDRFHFAILGLQSYFELFRHDDGIDLFDATGALFGTFRPSER